MYTGPVIDCDVHHAAAAMRSCCHTFRRGWRRYVADRGPAGIMPLTVQDGLPNPHGFMRADAYPPTGGPAGSDLDTMRRQLLDRGDIRRAILTFGDDSHVAGHHNPVFRRRARARAERLVGGAMGVRRPAAGVVDPGGRATAG